MITQKRNKSILIIDDDSFVADSMRQMLSFDFEKVVALNSPSQGIEEAGNNAYDLIVCDYKMPEMTGIDVISKIREQGIKTPFILVSGFLEEPEVKQAKALGAQEFLSKPFEILTFMDLVDSTLTEDKEVEA